MAGTAAAAAHMRFPPPEAVYSTGEGLKAGGLSRAAKIFTESKKAHAEPKTAILLQQGA
jgi:hypothetical protein